MDICQSVLASFFLRVASGQYDLDNPRRLVALLTKMAEKKLAMHSRSHFRQRRDARRTQNLADGSGQVPSKEVDPGQRAADRDLLRQAYDLMGPEVRAMAELRMAGAHWSEVAAKLGGTPDGRRKQYQRAIDQTARQLGLD
jgi:RNA polymerase sigma-70 factor (ECF subfamily)